MQEKLKRLNKCPVCAENLNYEEPPPPRPPVRQNVIVTERNFMLFNLCEIMDRCFTRMCSIFLNYVFVFCTLYWV